MEEVNLLTCREPYVWKSDAKKKAGKPRRYEIDPILHWHQRIDTDRVNNTAEYYSGSAPNIITRAKSKVILFPDCQVKTPQNLIERLETPTDFYFDRTGALETFKTLDIKAQERLIIPISNSVGTQKNITPLAWNQGEAGRLHARKPCVQNIPSRQYDFRKHLKPMEHGTSTFLIDATSMHPNHAFRGEENVPDNKYEYLATLVPYSPADIKAVFTAMDSGQTTADIMYLGMVGRMPKEKSELYVRIHNDIKLALQFKHAEVLNRMADTDKVTKTLWEQDIMQRFMSLALESVDLSGFIPMHDGLLFSANGQSDADKVKNAFEYASAETEGKPLGCKLELVA
jgi:hypothetical protein